MPLCFQKRFPEALALGLSFYQDKGKAVVGLRGSKQRRKQIARDKVCQVLIQYMEELNRSPADESTDFEIVTTCVDYCIQLENTELLFGKLWDLVSEVEGLKASYLHALESPLLDGSLRPRLPPLIAQQLVALYDQEEKVDSLQAIIVLLDVDCLDIHQVSKSVYFLLNNEMIISNISQVTTICRQRGLWEALIHLQTTALGDYTAPIHQLVPTLQSLLKAAKDSPTRDSIQLGNAILVYTAAALPAAVFLGMNFPRGNPSEQKRMC